MPPNREHYGRNRLFNDLMVSVHGQNPEVTYPRGAIYLYNEFLCFAIKYNKRFGHMFIGIIITIPIKILFFRQQFLSIASCIFPF